MTLSRGVNSEVFQIVTIALGAIAMLFAVVFVLKRILSKKKRKSRSNTSADVKAEQQEAFVPFGVDQQDMISQLELRAAQKEKEIELLKDKCRKLERKLEETENRAPGGVVHAKVTVSNDDIKRILVVEENEKTLKKVVDILRGLDYKVETAANGYIALRMIENAQRYYYSLILMDAIMADLSGYETAIRIRKLEKSEAKTIPIVVMSANTFERDIRMANEAKINDTVKKPIDAKQLESVIRKNLPFDIENFNYII